MAEPASKVAQQAEEQLDRLADTVRKKFDAITGTRYASRPRPVAVEPVPTARNTGDRADEARPGPGRATRGRPTGQGAAEAARRPGPDRAAPSGPGAKSRRNERR
ncbi:hypothetical protein GA0074692_4984 [Micromonospora pallida]|uniref:Uncharacterized protein n=1 Tax=Micromonospora pallida TaxID=145854 RepID=A0A1C6T9N6_9ACTN|nr:hypothetical protein [Micromonospora pallida]SCL38357.1 hypothetical protein GA0074692_4984 [Micromonospora pallida]